ncbi:hypothetical protein ACIQ9P_03720 [Kitasatospora sp. NPDC094019]|uniref:hypothetical protein n=1 Tax=Kitasatospora sp. NPDC094019 TaxID=3364091 RepID=UPI003815E4D1
MGFQLNIETADNDDDDTCWHLSSNLGMASLCGIMRTFGMLADPPVPHWPSITEFGLTRADFTAPGEVVPGKEDRLAAVRAAVDAARADADPHPLGIPRHKLASQLEQWLIVPGEVTAALTAYDARAAAERADAERTYPGWSSWLRFLRSAAAGDHSIRVY